MLTRNVDARLHGKGNSNSHGARPVHLIITMMKWIRTSRLSIKNSLSYCAVEWLKCLDVGRVFRARIDFSSEAGSYLRRIDFVYHSTLGLRVIKKKKTSMLTLLIICRVWGLGFGVYG